MLRARARYACEPGDEAILFDPVDFLFGKAVDHAGARKVYSGIDKETGEIDVEDVNELVTDGTRLLCICNPHNPLRSRADMERRKDEALRTRFVNVWASAT